MNESNFDHLTDVERLAKKIYQLEEKISLFKLAIGVFIFLYLISKSNPKWDVYIPSEGFSPIATYSKWWGLSTQSFQLHYVRIDSDSDRRMWCYKEHGRWIAFNDQDSYDTGD